MANNDNNSGIDWAYWRGWFYWILAIYFSWTCNRNETFFMRMIYLIIAHFFSFYYVLFYIGYHYILREPCSQAFGSEGVLV